MRMMSLKTDVPPPPRPPDRSATAPVADRPLSKLAVVSLVLSALVCLPFAMGGIITGAIASARIRASQGRVRGMPIAITAMVLGATMLIAQSIVLEWASREVASRNSASVQELTTAVFAANEVDQAKGVARDWSEDPRDRVEHDAVLMFARTLAERYGSIRHVEIVGTEPSGRDLTHQLVTSAVIFAFERGERPGSVTTVLSPAPGEFFPPAKLVEVIVEDRERGNLRLGAETASPLALPSSSPAMSGTGGGGGGAKDA